MQDAVHAISAGAGGRIFIGAVGDRRLQPHSHHNQQALKCPRCDSPNTKFCYYNNYNLSQPRHFCKSCRRYWTKGGVLRNVPVGGGCRKAKRSSSSSSAKAKSTKEGTVLPNNQPEISTVTTNKSSSSTETNTTQLQQEGDHKTTSSVHNESSGLLVAHQDHQQQSMEVGQQQHDLEDFTTPCTMMTSSSEHHLMGFSTDHMINLSTTSYVNEFKVVDYGDPGLFDLTAAVDPNYWNYQASLNFLP